MLRCTGIMLVVGLALMSCVAFGSSSGTASSDTSIPPRVSTSPWEPNAQVCEKEEYVCYLRSHIVSDGDPAYLRTLWLRSKVGLMGGTPGYKEPVRIRPCATGSIVEFLEYDVSGLVLVGKHSVADCCHRPTGSTSDTGSNLQASYLWNEAACKSWYQVRTPSGKLGWVSSSIIGSITATQNVSDRFRDYTEFTAQDEASSSPKKLVDHIVNDWSLSVRQAREIDLESKIEFRVLSIIVLDADHAVAIADLGPLLDDSVQGERYSFYMKRHSDVEAGKDYWRLDYVMMRLRCKRGVGRSADTCS